MKSHILHKTEDKFLSKIHNDLKIFNNLSFILNKLQKEGHFQGIKDIINKIFGIELRFTLESNHNQNYTLSRKTV
jgi:hypothetical protein